MNDGIDLKIKNVKKIIDSGFVLRLRGATVNWQTLMTILELGKLPPTERQRRADAKLDEQMRAYWRAAVAYVENPNMPHPGRLLDQPFAKARQMRIHEVDILLRGTSCSVIASHLLMLVRIF